jgi:hypothetical protein
MACLFASGGPGLNNGLDYGICPVKKIIPSYAKRGKQEVLGSKNLTAPATALVAGAARSLLLY